MSLPQDLIFPWIQDFKEFSQVNRYLRDLTYQLQNSYQLLAEASNGEFRGNTFVESQLWTPTLMGTITPGTFTYVNQIGWSVRRNLLVDVWFDVEWTASGGAVGSLFLELPYLVAKSEGMPFTSALQTSTISYGVGYTLAHLNAIPNTYRGEIWVSGSGLLTTNLAVQPAGRIIGHIHYLGQEDET